MSESSTERSAPIDSDQQALHAELRELREKVASVETVIRLHLPENDVRPLDQQVVAAARSVAAMARKTGHEEGWEDAASICDDLDLPEAAARIRALVSGSKS